MAGAGPARSGLILSQEISPRRSTVSKTWAVPRIAGRDVSDNGAQLAGPDRQHPEADQCLQCPVEHGRADLGPEGRVDVGAHLRAGQGQMGHRRDEPPELDRGRVPGGTTAVAGAAVAAGPAGVAGADVPGEPHAPASSTTVVLSATWNGHAGRPGLRSREPSFTVSSLLRGGPRNERHGARPVPAAGFTLSRHAGDHHT